MIDEYSIDRQLHRDSSLVPAYCPRSKCRNHLPETARERFWSRYGRKMLTRFPYLSQRYKCNDCGATFSASIFRIDYRQKKWGKNAEIFKMHRQGISKRETARELKCSERLVRTRLRNMSRFAELKDAHFQMNLPIAEPIAYDGVENFAFSQYDPNNINHAVGKDSLFIYDFNFAPINRKGRMSPRQALRKQELEKAHGKYKPDAIRITTRKIFQRLHDRCKGALTVFSDNHFQYRRVVELDLPHLNIQHFKVSSKIHRNYRNHLFAVNNIDLQARQGLAPFRRETISFSKHEIAMNDCFRLYSIYRNYMRPKFWGTHRSDPLSAKRSPAMELGITRSILSFDDFFSERVMPTQVQLNEDAQARYDRICKGSRRKINSAPAI